VPGILPRREYRAITIRHMASAVSREINCCRIAARTCMDPSRLGLFIFILIAARSPGE
jgi:hypothetical protein